MPKIIDLPEVLDLDGEETVLIEKNGVTARSSLWNYVRGLRLWIAPIFIRPLAGLPDNWGGYSYHQKPAQGSGLGGDVITTVVGNEMLIGDLDGDGRGVRLDILSCDTNFGSRLLTDRAPLLRPQVGAPANFGGYMLLGLPQSGSTLSAPVLAGIVGDEFQIFENGGTGRGLTVSLSEADASKGTRLLTDRAPMFRPRVGAPVNYGGYFTMAKPLFGTDLDGDILGGIVGDRVVSYVAATGNRGVGIPVLRGLTNFRSNVVLDSDGGGSLAYVDLYQRSFHADVRSIEIHSYYAAGEPGVGNTFRWNMIRVENGTDDYAHGQDADGNWWKVAPSPVIRPEMFGAKGAEAFGPDTGPDVIPDETAIIRFMVDQFASYGQEVYLGRVFRVESRAALRNFKGCRFTGLGDIVYATTAGNPGEFAGHISAIDNRHDHLLLSTGEEYLDRVRQAIIDRAPVPIVMYGDSKKAGNGDDNGLLSDDNNFAQNIIPQIAVDHGLRSRFTVLNCAVAGMNFDHQWAGCSTVKADGITPADGWDNYPYLYNGMTPLQAIDSGRYKMMIIPHGTNEFTNLDNDADRPGVVDDLIAQIVLRRDDQFTQMMARPNAASMGFSYWGPGAAEHVRFQTSDAMRKLDIAMKSLCRRHKIHHLSFYDLWTDAARMGGRTMDSPALLHPLDVHAAAEWGFVRDTFRRIFVTADATNRFNNPPREVETKGPGAPPSGFILGESRHEVSASDGWAADGWIRTTRTGGGRYAEQTFRRYDTGARQERVKLAGSDAWGAWA